MAPLLLSVSAALLHIASGLQHLSVLEERGELAQTLLRRFAFGSCNKQVPQQHRHTRKCLLWCFLYMVLVWLLVRVLVALSVDVYIGSCLTSSR